MDREWILRDHTSIDRHRCRAVPAGAVHVTGRPVARIFVNITKIVWTRATLVPIQIAPVRRAGCGVRRFRVTTSRASGEVQQQASSTEGCPTPHAARRTGAIKNWHNHCQGNITTNLRTHLHPTLDGQGAVTFRDGPRRPMVIVSRISRSPTDHLVHRRPLGARTSVCAAFTRVLMSRRRRKSALPGGRPVLTRPLVSP